VIGSSSLLAILALSARAQEPAAPQSAPVAATVAVAATEADLRAYQEDAVRFAGGVQRLRGDVYQIVADFFAEEDRRRGRLTDVAVKRREQERDNARLKAATALEAYLCTYAPQLVDQVNDCTKPPAPRTVRAKDIVSQGLRLAQLYREAEGERHRKAVKLDSENLADFSRPVAIYERLLSMYADDPELDGAYAGLAAALSYNAYSESDTAQAVQTDVSRARELRETLLQRYPKSKLVIDAHLWLGEHYIVREDGSGPEETIGFLEASAGHYSAVVATGPGHPAYDVALFKLANSNFLLGQAGVPGRMDVALSFAEQAIERGKERRRGLRLLKEIYVGISSPRLMRDGTTSPKRALKDVVLEHVARAGDKPWAHDLVVLGADLAWDQLDWDGAVALYTYAQERWPDHPNNPIYQYNIVAILRGYQTGWVVASDGVEAPTATECKPADTLCASLVELGAAKVARPPGDERKPEAIAALEELNRRYGRKSAWSAANQGEPAARERSAALIRAEAESLIVEKYNVAVTAYEPIARLPEGTTPPPDLLAASQAAWGTFVDEVDALLDANPALRTPRRQYDLGKATYLAGRLDDSIRRLEALVGDPAAATCRTGDDTDPGSLCVEDARRIAWNARRDLLVTEVGGDAKTTPGFTLANDFPSPILVEGIEREEVTPFGRTLKRLALPARVDAFMKATDAHLAFAFTDPKIVAGIKSDRLTLAYQLAQLDFAYGRFPEARKRFMEVIESAPPCTDAGACVELKAANLYLKTWELAGDGEQVALAAAQFSKRFSSGGGALASAVANFKDIEQGNRFSLINDRDPVFGPEAKRAKNADPEVLAALAAEYIAYAKDYPAKAGYRGGGDETGKDAPAEVALGRACALLAQSGRVDDSLRRTEEFVTKYPLSKFSAGFYWQLADSADKAFVQTDAVKWYQTFAEETARNAARPGWGEEIARLGESMVDATHAYSSIAVLREAMDAPAATANAWEFYATRYAPATTDPAKGLFGAEEAFWRARDFWRQVGDAELAKFYERYLKQRFADANPSNTVVAWDELASIYERRGEKRAAQTARVSAGKAYQAALTVVAADPKKVVTKDAHAIGMKDAMVKLEAEWKATQPAPWSNNLERNLDMLLGDGKKKVGLIKLVEIERVGTAASVLTGSPDFDAQQMGGYYLGLAWARHAALLRTDRPSPLALAAAFPIDTMGLEPDSVEYEAILGLLRDGDQDGDGNPDLEGSEAAEQKAIEILTITYRQAVAPSIGKPQWSPWTAKTLEALSVELRAPGFARDRAVYCGDAVCGTSDVSVSVDTTIAPITTAREGSK
jgi:TolA-binding protein